METLDKAKRSLMRTHREIGWVMTDIEDSSIPGIFWGKHPAGGNWLFYLRLVEGRTLPPIPKATREALKTKALERRANVVICQVRLGAGGEVLRVTSKNLDR